VNLIYNSGFNWANPNVLNLEQQARAVLFNEHPIELGWSDKEAEILARLVVDKRYAPLFNAAFGSSAYSVTTENIILALASFERSLISGRAAYDRFTQGETNAITPAAKRGLNLFFSERMECFHCHGGFNLTQTVDYEGLSFNQLEFFNNGLYNVAGTGAYPADNTGLWEFTQTAEDMGKFRAPSLRNIALTAPYMHDGSLLTLRDVLNHYSRGGSKIDSGANAGDGALNPYKSGLIAGFNLTQDEQDDVLAFFDSLTDWEFICAPEHNDPFERIAKHARCNSAP
jgi:cytochrome c peroxidase